MRTLARARKTWKQRQRRQADRALLTDSPLRQAAHSAGVINLDGRVFLLRSDKQRKTAERVRRHRANRSPEKVALDRVTNATYQRVKRERNKQRLAEIAAEIRSLDKEVMNYALCVTGRYPAQ